MVDKALAATAVVYAAHLKLAAGSCRVAFPQLVNAERSGNNYSQELPCFNVGNLNRFNRNRLRLKRLIPIERDLNVIMDLSCNSCKRGNS